MADIVDQKTRSRMMSGIRGRNTKPELIVRRALHAAGFRYRLHRSDLPGRPDIVLPGRRIAILVHGCFWHRHEGCSKCTAPATRAEFWQAKFDRNITRDRENIAALEAAGWAVYVVWECETRGKATFWEALATFLAGHPPAARYDSTTPP